MAVTKRVVVISSTSLDLPAYRNKVIKACRRFGCDTVEMENLTADSAPPVDVSRHLVDEADIDIGIFAHRYGKVPHRCVKVPDGETRSITEMEFDRAEARGISRLLFVMDPAYPWPQNLIEHAAYARLEAFKESIGRPGSGHCVARFTTEDNLGLLVAQALNRLGTIVPDSPGVDETLSPAPRPSCTGSAI